MDYISDMDWLQLHAISKSRADIKSQLENRLVTSIPDWMRISDSKRQRIRERVSATHQGFQKFSPPLRQIPIVVGVGVLLWISRGPIVKASRGAWNKVTSWKQRFSKKAQFEGPNDDGIELSEFSDDLPVMTPSSSEDSLPFFESDDDGISGAEQSSISSSLSGPTSPFHMEDSLEWYDSLAPGNIDNFFSDVVVSEASGSEYQITKESESDTSHRSERDT